MCICVCNKLINKSTYRERKKKYSICRSHLIDA